MKRLFFLLVYWTWCFPQTFLGLLWWVAVRVLVDRDSYSKPYHCNSVMTKTKKIRGGISLGMFIFSGDYGKSEWNSALEKHEYGHVLQSFRLGWLYLLVVGLPSVLWAWLYTLKLSAYFSYSWFYTESWADRLGKVKINS
jgi:hypothetical protein